MAIPTVKSTYVMDVETAQALERIARRWNVSRSEALRRAIRAAADQREPGSSDALTALDDLPKSLKLTPGRMRGWTATSRRERKAASVRSEARRR